MGNVELEKNAVKQVDRFTDALATELVSQAFPLCLSIPIWPSQEEGHYTSISMG
jgi:hypothetical protein